MKGHAYGPIVMPTTVYQVMKLLSDVYHTLN
uniref:Uncharacterized protein n=1 Tax=Arundo donax TaxID=35708 RepID=A0A0A9A0I7_ARUDO